MITLETKTKVAELSGKEVTDFLLNPKDENYRKWWGGIHLEFHIIKSYPGHIGDIVYMDEFIGRHRVKMKGIVVNAIPGKLIIWQLKKIIKLPVRLSLKLEEDKDSVKITHTIRVGFGGIGKIFDPILGIYFSEDFKKAMDEHVKIEFQKLSDILH